MTPKSRRRSAASLGPRVVAALAACWLGAGAAEVHAAAVEHSSSTSTAAVVDEVPPARFYAEARLLQTRIAKADELAAWLKEGSVVLLDLRSSESYARSHIRGAVSLPATELTTEALRKVVPTPDARVVVYCDDNLAPTRMIALTTLSYPAIYRLGYHNLYRLEELWMSPSCRSTTKNAAEFGGGCPPLLVMERQEPQYTYYKWRDRLLSVWKRLRPGRR